MTKIEIAAQIFIRRCSARPYTNGDGLWLWKRYAEEAMESAEAFVTIVKGDTP